MGIIQWKESKDDCVIIGSNGMRMASAQRINGGMRRITHERVSGY